MLPSYPFSMVKHTLFASSLHPSTLEEDILGATSERVADIYISSEYTYVLFAGFCPGDHLDGIAGRSPKVGQGRN